MEGLNAEGESVMDEHRFDAMTKALGDGLTRRRVLGGITGGALASVLGWRSTAAAQCAKEGQKPKDAKKGCCQGLVEDQNTGRCVAGAGFVCPAGQGISICGLTPVFCEGAAVPNSCAAYTLAEGGCACASGSPPQGRPVCTEETAAVVCGRAATCVEGSPSGEIGLGKGRCNESGTTPCAYDPAIIGAHPDCAFLAECIGGFCGGQECSTNAHCGNGEVCISGTVFLPSDSPCCPPGAPCPSNANFCQRLCTV